MSVIYTSSHINPACLIVITILKIRIIKRIVENVIYTSYFLANEIFDVSRVE